MRKRRLKKSFYIILLSAFLAVIAPIYVLGYGIYQWGYEMTTNEILQSLNTRSSFFMKTLETEITRIRRLQYECLNDAGLFYFANASQIMDRFDYFEALLSLRERLGVMYNSSAYIANVNVYIPHMEKMVSAVNGVNPITDEWMRIVSAKADASEAGIIYLDGEMYLCAAYPTIPANPESPPLYLLIIQLSSRDIMDMIMSFNLYPEGGTMLTNPGQDHSMIVGDDIGLAGRIKDGTYRSGNGNVPGIDTAIRGGKSQRYIVVGNTSQYLNMDLYTYVSERLVYGDLYRYRTLFLIFSAVTFAMVAAFLWSANVLVNKPVKRLVKSFIKVEQGDLKVRILHHSSDEFSYLYNTFNQMVASLENMFEINYRQQLLTQEAELRQLQAQINPHFLHNSFFILYRMAKDEDYENITVFLTYLSDYYRYVTRNVQMEAPLNDEVMHAYRYAQIQLVRFNKRISINFAPFPRQYGGVIVPRLILQPLLENAFNHGLRDVAENGRLDVSFAEEDGNFVIKVEDNGAGMDKAGLEALVRELDSAGDYIESTGVVNIHRRLRLKFGKGYGLRIVNLESGGMRSEIVLPGSGNGADRAGQSGKET